MKNEKYVIKLELTTDKETVEKVYALVLAELSKANRDEGYLVPTGFSMSLQPVQHDQEIIAEIKKELDEEWEDYFKYLP